MQSIIDYFDLQKGIIEFLGYKNNESLSLIDCRDKFWRLYPNSNRLLEIHYTDNKNDLIETKSINVDSTYSKSPVHRTRYFTLIHCNYHQDKGIVYFRVFSNENEVPWNK